MRPITADKFQLLVRSPFFSTRCRLKSLFAVWRTKFMMGQTTKQHGMFPSTSSLSYFLFLYCTLFSCCPPRCWLLTARPPFCSVSLQNSNLEYQRATSWIEMPPRSTTMDAQKKERKPPTAASSACPLHLIPIRQGEDQPSTESRRVESQPPHTI